jgi:hypothetical protein
MKRRVSRISEEVSTDIRIGYLFHEDRKKSRMRKCVFFKMLLIRQKVKKSHYRP